MSGLVGEYEVKLDAKGRFLFPSHLRRQLSPAAQENFMLNKGFEECLTLYPMNEWDTLSEKLSKLNLFKPKNRMFYRLFHQGAKQVALDSAGRVHIPVGHMDDVLVCRKKRCLSLTTIELKSGINPNTSKRSKETWPISPIWRMEVMGDLDDGEK